MQDSRKLCNDQKACKSYEVKPRGITEWVDYYQKNKPQTNALAAGLMIVLYGGQQLGWGIFNNHMQAQPWAGGYEDEGTVFWAIISWFIAAIVGFFVSALLVNNFSKISIYMFAGVLSGISAVLFIISPESIYYIFPARILAGLAHGIVYPTVLIHASEVSIARLRGMVVSGVHLCLFIGVFTTSSSLSQVYKTRSYEIDPTRLVGINGLICIVSGLVIAAFFNRESPVFLIRKYRDQEAINIMIRLRSESHETADIQHDFDELKLMVFEDTKSNVNIFERSNLWPLFVVTFMKVIFVASFNLPLNLVWLEAVESKFYDGMTDPSGMCLSGARWIVILLMMFLIDCKRIPFYMASSFACSVILVLLFKALDTAGFDESTKIMILAFVFQIFSGVAIALLADIYSTEAFNTKKKPLSIAFTSAIEFLLQILTITIFFYFENRLALLLFYSALALVLGILAFKVPDTSHMSLRNARNKFGS